MSGVVAGLIGSVKAGAAPTNLVHNPSFTVNASGWFGSYGASRDTSIFRSAPAGFSLYYNPEDIGYINYAQNVLTVGQRYSLSFWVRNPDVSQSFNYTMYCGTNSVTANSGVLLASPDWQYLKLENVLCTANNALNIDMFPMLGLITIDDVSVVLGATALP